MSDKTTLKGIEQGRAEFAYDKAEAAKRELSKDNSAKYKQYSKKIPAMIKTNGLGATMTFIHAKASGKKKDPAYEALKNDITAWLGEDYKSLIMIPDRSFLAAEVVKLKSPEYRAVTAEVLALMNWLRRFAEGLIEWEVTE